MKYLGLIIGILGLSLIISSCTVQVCHPGKLRCHTECYDYCCDGLGCWDCNCHEVCRDDCYLDQPDSGK